MPVQNAGGRGGRDRDAALLLLLHPVHGRRAFVHLANLVIDAGVEQDAFGRRRLAGIDVGHDAEVAITLDGSGACHGVISDRSTGSGPNSAAIRLRLATSPAWMRGLIFAVVDGRQLPAVVRERLVGFRHAVRFFALLDRAAAVFGSFEQLGRQLARHRCSRRACAPPRSASASPAPCGATGALRPAPGRWRRRRGATSPRPPARRCSSAFSTSSIGSAFFSPIASERAVDDLLGDRLLAALHHHVDEAGDRSGCRAWDPAAQTRAGCCLYATCSFSVVCGSADRVLRRRGLCSSTRPNQDFGRFAPYFERLWRRLATPAASSEPRTVW